MTDITLSNISQIKKHCFCMTCEYVLCNQNHLMMTGTTRVFRDMLIFSILLSFISVTAGNSLKDSLLSYASSPIPSSTF